MRRKNDTLYKDPRSSEIVETDAKSTPQEKHDKPSSLEQSNYVL
jgi:hypothetical protein